MLKLTKKEGYAKFLEGTIGIISQCQSWNNMQKKISNGSTSL